jgi:hypothetical protein
MSGEVIAVWGTRKVLEASGAAITNNALALADDATYDVVNDGLSYPDAQFILTGTFAVAPAEGAVLSLLARPLAVDGVNDTQVPETTRPTRVMGSFVVDNVTTPQTIEFTVTDVPQKAAYYLYNSSTGQTLSAGWVLSVKPKTYKVA